MGCEKFTLLVTLNSRFLSVMFENSTPGIEETNLVGPFPFRHVPCSCIQTAQGDWAKNPDIPLIKMQANILKSIKYRDQKSTAVRFLGIKNKEVDLSGM